MKLIKIFYIVLLSVLIFTIGCESPKEDGARAEEAKKNAKLTTTIDSLNTMLSNYKAEGRELSEKIADLKEKSNKNDTPPPKKDRVIYKTKIEYKTDEAVLADLEAQKRKVQYQLAQIRELKDAIAQKEGKLNKMQNQVEELELAKNEMFTSEDVSSLLDVIIRRCLTISDIDVKLYSKRIKDRKGNIEVIETSFTVNENKLAEKGSKVIYLCIYDDKHNILHHEESETFKIMDGKDQYYTTKSQFSYAEEKLRLTILWEKKDVELSPGTYMTKFYIDNVLSSIGTFNIE